MAIAIEKPSDFQKQMESYYGYAWSFESWWRKDLPATMEQFIQQNLENGILNLKAGGGPGTWNDKYGYYIPSLSDKAVIEILNILRTKEKEYIVLQLVLVHHDLSINGFKAIAEYIKGNPRLEYLDLTRSYKGSREESGVRLPESSESGTAVILDAMRQNNKIKYLNLSDTYINESHNTKEDYSQNSKRDDERATVLYNSMLGFLKENTILTDLDISSNQLDRRGERFGPPFYSIGGTRAVCEGLNQNKALRTLNIGRALNSSKVFETLKGNTTLTHLSMSEWVYRDNWHEGQALYTSMVDMLHANTSLVVFQAHMDVPMNAYSWEKITPSLLKLSEDAKAGKKKLARLGLSYPSYIENTNMVVQIKDNFQLKQKKFEHSSTASQVQGYIDIARGDTSFLHGLACLITDYAGLTENLYNMPQHHKLANDLAIKAEAAKEFLPSFRSSSNSNDVSSPSDRASSSLGTSTILSKMVGCCIQ